ncbi:MAG TPA: SIS domain-containing protein [Candidatus Hydrogenedentes bacterium]|nr:SIS domain-containing protein [Candidatus Hydrogenedentota bacterium]
MSKLWDDIERQMSDLRQCLGYTTGAGKSQLDLAAALVAKARHVIITGIGASWHAGMGVQHLFHMHGIPAHLVDTAELEIMWPIPADATLIILSRSGKSIEIVRTLDKAEAAKANIIAITNALESPLADRAHVSLLCNVPFDNAASIGTYTSPGLVGGLLAAHTAAKLSKPLTDSLDAAFAEAGARLQTWRTAIRRSDWLDGTMPTFFLARGASLASCHEARLLWLEVARAPSLAMATGAFRHGPQEILADGPARIALWLEPERFRRQDLVLVQDLRKRRCNMLMIGQDVPNDPREVSFDIPKVPADWQFLVDIVPIQIAAELYAMHRGYNPDKFEVCSYVVESEGGL